MRALMLGLMVCACAGCPGTDPPDDGFLLVLIETEPLSGKVAGLESLNLSGPRIDVVHRADCTNPATEHVVTVAADPVDLEIPMSPPHTQRLLARLVVPAGCVEQVRFITDRMTIDVSGQTLPAKVPSGPQTGIKVNPSDKAPQSGKAFPIIAGDTTTILIDYDANKQIVINRGQGVIEKPTLTAVEIPKNTLPFSPDEIVVTFKPGTAPADVMAAVNAQGTVLREYPDHLFVTVKLPDPGQMFDALDYYNHHPSVVVALPNNTVIPQGPNPFPMGMNPDDPTFADSMALPGLTNQLAQVNVAPGWALTTGYSVGPVGRKPPIIAVIDNGFNLSHRDLVMNTWVNQREITRNGALAINDVDGDGRITFADLNDASNAAFCDRTRSAPNDLCDPMDILTDNRIPDGSDSDGNGFNDDMFGWDFAHGPGDTAGSRPTPNTSSRAPEHGSTVAAIAAGRGNNALAYTGTAWNAQIMFLKANELSPNRDQFLSAARYALDNGADVIQSSLGFTIVLQGSSADGSLTVCPGRNVPLPQDKFTRALAGLPAEWAEVHRHGSGHALMVFSKIDCPGQNDDDPNAFSFPSGYSATRSGFTADPDVIGVTSATSVRSTMPPLVSDVGDISRFASFGPASTQLAAPGEMFPFLSITDPDGFTIGMGCTATSRNPCSGTSFAAPMVSGAAILCMAANLPAFRNSDTMDATAVANLRAVLLNNAVCPFIGMCTCTSADSSCSLLKRAGVERGRLLNVGAAVTAASMLPSR